MADFQLRQPANFQSIYEANEVAIFNDLDANPGTTEAAMVTRTGLNALLVAVLLKTFRQQQIAVTGASFTGAIVFWWTAADFQAEMLTNRAAARTWMAANNGARVSDMVVALGINEFVAQMLALFLEQEGSAKIVPE